MFYALLNVFMYFQSPWDDIIHLRGAWVHAVFLWCVWKGRELAGTLSAMGPGLQLLVPPPAPRRLVCTLHQRPGVALPPEKVPTAWFGNFAFSTSGTHISSFLCDLGCSISLGLV